MTCKNGRHQIRSDADWIFASAGHGRVKRHCRACYRLKQARKRAKWTSTRLVVAAANTRARALGLTATLTEREWLKILEDYNHECAYCFAPYEHLEHRVALKDGGPTTAENVVPSCASCNAKKSARRLVPSITSRFWPPDGHLLRAKGGHLAS